MYTWDFTDSYTSLLIWCRKPAANDEQFADSWLYVILFYKFYNP